MSVGFPTDNVILLPSTKIHSQGLTVSMLEDKAGMFEVSDGSRYVLRDPKISVEVEKTFGTECFLRDQGKKHVHWHCQ